MNFFQRQTETRRLSRQLVVLFVVAVICVIIGVDLVLFTVLASVQPGAEGLTLPNWAWLSAHPGIVFVTTLSVVGVIGLSSLYKTIALNGGGGVVARSLGGVRVSPDTTDPQQRRLLNVVEEMSIASGVPMPEVYLLEQEGGINAFAAGHNPANAAIAVTRGALTTLNRAELQGVIAHEFSHILNGDMRLNVRLMGLLFGLLVIALIARTVLRFAPRGGSNKKGGGAVAAILVAAFVVLIVGYVGLFFGRLIQAAVSRNRESLADASAVQFTRDPGGLRGALVKIGANTTGSRIGNPEAEEVAHMLFAPGIKRFFATHPELEDRLKAIDPRFNKNEFAQMRERLARQEVEAPAPVPSPEPTAHRLESIIALPTTAGAVGQLVGNPATLHMEVAREIRLSLPEVLSVAGRHPSPARALLLSLALDPQPEARQRQRNFIDRQLGADIATEVAGLLPAVDALEPQQRMPLLTHAFPALRQLTRDERVQLMACLNGMLQREGSLSLPSYVLRKLAQVHLRDDLDPRGRRGKLSLDAVTSDLQTLLSVLAHHGHQQEQDARRAYEAGMHHLLPRQRPGYLFASNWPMQLDVALSRLDQLMPVGKEQLIEALVKTVGHDNRLTIGEAELLRAVCAALHCPLPPLVAEASV
ncbi:Zn-dependent protease with chaperone function [Povalibacter uvarum]|uniref:Zn-dependent protease with chaperone function n=1 Tax=Povalibacter uvarum TaxID=732238 RepID=A0A841HNX5_9GAMM|nr:M48 family metallopeptidase [Povalibacter uvarum]MBB6094576.1 Zn-dependent protease with chaperone function [Povalibacter uvarum]